MSKNILAMIVGQLRNSKLSQNLIYLTPLRHMLRGFCCDKSGYNQNIFYLYAFAMPLYIPADYIDFTFGIRLKNRMQRVDWDITDPQLQPDLLSAIQEQGIPYLEKYNAPIDLIHIVESKSIYNIYDIEYLAYSHLLCNNYNTGYNYLNHLVTLLNQSIDWQNTILNRAKILLNYLEHDHRKVNRLLDIWVRKSVRHLLSN